MSDDRKGLLDGIDDLDWGNALEEWEKTSFGEPAPAKPAPAKPAPAPPPAATAPEPPATAPDPVPPATAPDAFPPATAPEGHLGARSDRPVPFSEEPPKGPGGSVVPRPNPMLANAGPTGTVIAPVPRELRQSSAPILEPPRPPARSDRGSVPPGSLPPGSIPPGGSVPPPRPSSRPSTPSSPSRGGLNQLFSRPRLSTPGAVSVPGLSPTAPPPSSRSAPSTEPQPHAPSEKTVVSKDAPSEKTVVGPALKDLPSVSPPAPEDADDETAIHPAALAAARAASQAHSSAPPAKPAEERAPPEEIPDDVTNEWPALKPSTQTASARVLASSIQQSLEDTGENETLVFDRKSISDAETANRLPADDEMPTLGRPSKLPLPPLGAPPSTDSAPASFEGEQPGAKWLDEKKASALQTRIAWLEEEARAIGEDSVRARALLAVSELCAIAGEHERGLAFALEARDADPELPLARRQARQLLPHDPDTLVEALDQEAATSPTPSARAHATLLAADILRINSLGDAAVERWDSACKLDPTDTRGPIARAVLALAQSDHSSGALRLAENSELIAFDKAVATALRLRGVERPGAEVDDMPINDGLRHARAALGSGDVVAAAQSIGEIASVPELAKGALWLSAALGSTHIASRRASARSLKTLAADGEALARRQLAARGLELGDPELVTTALGSDESAATDTAFDPAERTTLRVFATPKGAVGNVDAASIEFLSGDRPLEPLEDALSAMSPIVATGGGVDEQLTLARARRVSGRRETRVNAALGRMLATGASDAALDEVLTSIGVPRPPSSAGVAIETAVRAHRWPELSEALSNLPEGNDSTSDTLRHIAAALVAERADHRERAIEAWRAAVSGAAVHDGILRIAAGLDPSLKLGPSLLRLAEGMPDGIGSAVLRLEALSRTPMSEAEQSPILADIHRAAPSLGVGAFLAERMGRRKGDLDEVLRWIQERRAYATDPLETALDAVREALLVADRDPELASSRLTEALQARPDDVALRELYERLATEPPADRGLWRDKRALAVAGANASLQWVEAALEHDRAGDREAALASARRAATTGDRGLSEPLIERIELDLGQTTRQSEALREQARSEDDRARREALERLAAIEGHVKHNVAAASALHRAILETAPRYKPSLRWLEHVAISEGRGSDSADSEGTAGDQEGVAAIFELVALALDGSPGGEATAHAQHAARLRAREVAADGSGAAHAWERTHDMARLAASQPDPALWSLRALNAHARVRKDDEAIRKTSLELVERTPRTPERATLLLRASEACSRLGRIDEARAHLEQAATEDPGDVVTWGFLAELRERAGDARMAAEACESLARTSAVHEHQLLAWHDASKVWLEEVKDAERAMGALEAAAELDPSNADIFAQLSSLYAEKNLDAELARLLERRLSTIEDDDERVTLQVDLARAFVDMGDLTKAKSALQDALEHRPDHTTALAAMADLCAKEGDWAGAEQAYVRLARLLTDPADQRAMYEQLGEIYSVHAPNLSRAEVAFKEVLKRSPKNPTFLGKLIDVYKRQADVPHAVETQQELISLATDPDSRLAGLIELARIYEEVGRDPRRSEQVLDSARKEFPTSVVALRALAEFYARHRQMPAMQILLDRAAGDARRSFAQGRFVPSLFQVLHAAFELRGKRDAARVVAATLAAVEGHDSDLSGADARAIDPRLDDLLAPELMSPALRALLLRVGETLDAVAPVDLRSLKATPLPPGTPLGATIGSVATMIGLGALQILVSPQLGRTAVPLASNPPTVLVGEGLAKVKSERTRVFVAVRALKMILTRGSAMLRVPPADVAPLIAGLFNAFNPSYIPQGVNTSRMAEYARRIGPALPRNLDPTVGVIALEAAGMLGTQWPMLAQAAISWANRVALLAVGDPNAALDAIAWDKGEERAPTGKEERATWIARHVEARELMTFSVTDAYAEGRIRLGLDK